MEAAESNFVSFKTEDSLKTAVNSVAPSEWEVTIPLDAAEEIIELIADYDFLDALGEQQKEALQELEIFVTDTLAGMDKRHVSFNALTLIQNMISKIPLGNDE